MRKILFGAAIVVLLIFTGIVMYKGTDGGLNVWGFTDISEQNQAIDTKNAQLTNLVNSTYPQTIATLNNTTEALQKTKKEYEDQAVLLADSKYFKQTEKYKHEFILVKIGNYADDNKVDLRTVVTNSSVAGLYDINFTIIGKYADVANYIYDIENDSSLGYKIEDFVMVSASGTHTDDNGKTYTNEVKANFSCKEISIDLKWLDENETVIPGIITRGNPFINSMTTLTGDYKNETLDRSRIQQENTAEANTTNNNTTANNTTANNTTATNTTNTNSTQQMMSEANAVNGNITP